jgi:hypothetical protein
MRPSAWKALIRAVIADNLPLDRMIARVVYAAAAIERPGVIRIEGNRFSHAEIDDSVFQRTIFETAQLTSLGALPARRRRWKRALRLGMRFRVSVQIIDPNRGDGALQIARLRRFGLSKPVST